MSEQNFFCGLLLNRKDMLFLNPVIGDCLVIRLVTRWDQQHYPVLVRNKFGHPFYYLETELQKNSTCSFYT